MYRHLQGLTIATWFGWAGGYYFVNRPWKEENKYKYFSFFTLYSMVIWVFNIWVWVEFLAEALIFLSHRSLSDKLLSVSLIVFGMTTFSCIKFWFFVRADRIRKFMYDLKAAHHYRSESVKKVWCRYRALLGIVTVGLLGSACLLPMSASLHPNAKILYLDQPYAIIPVFLFMSLAHILSSHFSFIYVVVTTFHLLFALEGFFNQLRDQCRLRSYNSVSLLNFSPQKQVDPQDPSAGIREQQLVVENNEFDSPKKLLTREEILVRWRNVKRLCNEYDEVVGPIYLMVIVSSVVIVVHSLSTLVEKDFVEEHDQFYRFKIAFGATHLVYEGARLSTILVGSLFHRQVESRKEELMELVYLMDNSTSTAEMRKVLDLVQSWDWKISAWGIFVIDRHVIAGVISAVMSYVVILFQINMADFQGNFCKPCNSTI